MLTETCPKCESDLTGGLEGGGLDLTKASCHNCGHSVTVQPSAPAIEPAVETADVQVAEKPARAVKAAVAKKSSPKKKAAAKPVAKVASAKPVKEAEKTPEVLLEPDAPTEEVGFVVGKS